MTSSIQTTQAKPRSTKAHPPALRSRVIKAIRDEGMSRRAAARRFDVGESTAIRWAETYEKSGRCEALPQGGDRYTWRIDQHADHIRSRLYEVPDTTIQGLVDWLMEAHGFRTSFGAVQRFLKRHKLTHKKKRRSRARSSAPTGGSTT